MTSTLQAHPEQSWMGIHPGEGAPSPASSFLPISILLEQAKQTQVPAGPEVTSVGRPGCGLRGQGQPLLR